MDRKAVDEYRWSPLHWAVMTRSLKMVKLILSDPHLSRDEKQEYLRLEDVREITPIIQACGHAYVFDVDGDDDIAEVNVL